MRERNKYVSRSRVTGHEKFARRTTEGVERCDSEGHEVENGEGSQFEKNRLNV
jgi:hypothetical protein